MPLRCKVFARLNNCTNCDEADVTFVQTHKNAKSLFTLYQYSGTPPRLLLRYRRLKSNYQTIRYFVHIWKDNSRTRLPTDANFRFLRMLSVKCTYYLKHTQNCSLFFTTLDIRFSHFQHLCALCYKTYLSSGV